MEATDASRLVCVVVVSYQEYSLTHAEGGHRDWEEDPLGFDTNPMLLRAMCMAFE